MNKPQDLELKVQIVSGSGAVHAKLATKISIELYRYWYSELDSTPSEE